MTKGKELSQQEVARLVRAAKAGDRQAFGRLVEAYQDRIYGYLARMLGDPDEAEDVAQEVFVRAYRSLGKFRGASSFHTWLYRIASNLAIDVARKRKRQDNTAYSLDAPMEMGDEEYDREIPDESRAPDQISEQKQVQSIVRQAVMGLPDKLRDVMVLYELQGESYEDIADILEVPLGTVKSRLFNARGQLKKRLEAMVDTGELHVGS